jgi:hypothetical protein
MSAREAPAETQRALKEPLNEYRGKGGISAPASH